MQNDLSHMLVSQKIAVAATDKLVSVESIKEFYVRLLNKDSDSTVEKRILSREKQKLGIDELVSPKERVVKIFKEKKENGEIHTVDIVSAEMGDHHNHVQANGKKFTTLNELSLKNKMVLNLLQELGMFKIIFGRFSGKGVKAAGTMKIQCVEKTNETDIVKVKFNSEAEMQIVTDLYFPQGIGQLLYEYFQEEQMTYQNVSGLVEKIR